LWLAAQVDPTLPQPCKELIAAIERCRLGYNCDAYLMDKLRVDCTRKGGIVIPGAPYSR
jgi:hypothetical protein